MSVVSFEGFTPPPRYPPITTPWTQVEIEEAAVEAGPFTVIDTIDLADLEGGLDVEPDAPQIRNFSTDNATLEEGWYRVSFIDAATERSSPTAPEHNSNIVGDLPWLPVVGEVAAILRNRTKSVDGSGGEEGTFNENTRPTGRQTTELIHQAAGDLLDVVGDDLDEKWHRSVRSLAVIRAAMYVELSYYSEQIGTGTNARSIYPQLEAMYEKRLARLLKDLESDDIGVTPEDSAVMPSGGGFPTTAIGMEQKW